MLLPADLAVFSTLGDSLLVVKLLELDCRLSMCSAAALLIASLRSSLLMGTEGGGGGAMGGMEGCGMHMSSFMGGIDS